MPFWCYLNFAVRDEKYVLKINFILEFVCCRKMRNLIHKSFAGTIGRNVFYRI